MTRLSLLILAEYAPLAHLLFILVKFVSCSQFGRGVQQFQFRLWNLHLCQFAQDVCSLDRSDKMTGEWVVISSCVSNLLAVAKLFLKSLVRDFPLILKLHTRLVWNSNINVSLTRTFFSLRSRTVCSSFLCFFVRGFLVDTGVTQAFFFFALLAGRTKALLSSTPFSLSTSDENKVQRLFQGKVKQTTHSNCNNLKAILRSKNYCPIHEFLPCSSTTTSVFTSSAGCWVSLWCLPFQLCFFLSFPILNAGL